MSVNEKLSNIGELKFIEEIRKKNSKLPSSVVKGIGDDAAVVKFDSGNLVVTTDMLVEGTHFDFKTTTPYQLGRKSAAVNLSDIAAMGAEPQYIFISIGVPASAKIKMLDEFYKGLKDICSEYDVYILGGDTVCSDKWIISVTLTGKLDLKPAMRSSLKPGQNIYVSGYPGESGAGLMVLQDKKFTAFKKTKVGQSLINRHVNPTPRVDLGKYLVQKFRDIGMIDISDGVYNELHHLSKASNVGMKIILSDLPVSDNLAAYCRKMGLSVFDLVLFGGEDYELLFTTRHTFTPAELEKIEKKFDVGIKRIGKVAAGDKVEFYNILGEQIRCKDKTFRHF